MTEKPAAAAEIELYADGSSAAAPGDPNAAPPPIADITTVLQALADPVRIAIVRRLGECADARTCGSFELPVSKSTLSHHFKVLREAGLIVGRYEGTRKLISLRRDDLEAAYPGLLDSLLRAIAASPEPAEPMPEATASA